MLKEGGIVGILLLVFCAVSAIIMVSVMITGRQPSVPEPVRIPLLVIGFGSMAALLWMRFSGRFRR